MRFLIAGSTVKIRRHRFRTSPAISLFGALAITITLSSSSRPVASLAAMPPKNVVVVGAGCQGTSVAYQIAEHCAKNKKEHHDVKITLLEAKAPASAASGKGGGFMARSWGDGSPTQRLHHLAFDMYSELAKELNCETYRKLPVLSVSPGYEGVKKAKKDRNLGPIMPDWLDGSVGRISALGYGDDTAQITPSEFVHKMLERQEGRVEVVLGTCVGVDTDQGSERGSRKVTAVKYRDNDDTSSDYEEKLLPADAVIVSAGPWSCAAEDWFPGQSIQLPMEGVKSTSIVWKKPQESEKVDATALFCGEDDRYGTHLEVYPRPDGSIYICGIGGSEYVKKDDLKRGRFIDVCEANESRVAAATSSFQEMSSLYKNVGELDKTQSCMRPCPPDALPYMGRIPGYEGAFVNAGHNCWGIAWAPACGKAMAELVMEGESKSVDLSPFDPSRFTPNSGRGNRGRKRQGKNVGEQW